VSISISPNPTLAHPLAAAAKAQALAAARAAAVSIRELNGPDELRPLAELFDRVWETLPGRMLVPSELMRVMAYEGCYVAGVYDDTNGQRLIGGAVGFFGSDDVGPDTAAAFTTAGAGQGTSQDSYSGSATNLGAGTGADQAANDRWLRIHLHSHIAAVVPAAAGRHAGYALKLHQRAWALRHGVDRITWTFDPLVRGNAYFNLVKLAARASRYLVDFYGDMPDKVNAGHGSDRLLVDWALDSPQAVAAADGIRPEPPEIAPLLDAGAVLLSASGRDTAPSTSTAPSTRPLQGRTTGPRLLAGTPHDIHGLRQHTPDHARAWRYALREALTEALDRGYRITGFTRSGWYLLEHPASAASAARNLEEADRS
jgi:predicted GNAT superfamily acetyltransferase